MAKKPKVDYDHKSLHTERSYGFFWYDWLWRIARPILVVAAAVLIVGGIGMTGWQWLNNNYISPVDPQDQAPRTFTVKAGSSLSRVAYDLEQQQLVRNHSVFKYLTDFMGMGQKIQSGEYTLSRAMTLTQIIEQLAQGDGKPTTRKITVIPGWTIENIADQFVKDGVITDKEAFLNACKGGKPFADYYYVAEVLATPNVSQRQYVLEGYLSPNTYEVYMTASMEDIIRKLLSQTEATFPAEAFDRAEELGMTMDQVLTLASMIEKEAKTADFAKVSAVFHTRLKENMSLDSDVTIKYALNSSRMALSSQELNISSPYNSYRNKGLPPGPVCNPSPGAILAALYPDEKFMQDGYKFFCSADPSTGELVFSKNLREHEANAAKYRPLWIEYDRNRGIQ